MSNASTDLAWQAWGEKDPYYAVITDPKYRNANLDDAARQAFFDSGRRHVKYVLDVARRHLDEHFAPQRALDFGCGVGRLLVPLAEVAQATAGDAAEVVGVDISPAMLAEAQRNCEAFGHPGVVLLPSDDTLSAVSGDFDLVHTAIVLQHIDVPRGRELFARLVQLVRPGGVGAIQVTYAKTRYAHQLGQPPAPPPPAPPPPEPAPPPPASLRSTTRRWLRTLWHTPREVAAAPLMALPAVRSLAADPEMQMNAYPLGELAFLLQRAGVQRFHTEFTDHGGELGVFLFFRKPGKRPSAAKPAKALKPATGLASSLDGAPPTPAANDPAGPGPTTHATHATHATLATHAPSADAPTAAASVAAGVAPAPATPWVSPWVSPFVGPLRAQSHVCTFHKCGSNWFRHIVMALAGQLALDYEPVSEQPGRLNRAVRRGHAAGFLVYPSGHRREVLQRLQPGERTALCVRDPRDALVSQYWSWRESHRNNGEAIRRFRDELRALPVAEGLRRLVQDRRFAYGEQMRRWLEADLQQPDLCVLRYENLKADFHAEVGRALAFFEIDPSRVDVERLRVLTDFSTRTRRPAGQEDRSAHLRKGVVGDHADYFTDAALQTEFMAAYGDVMQRLGYGA